MHKGSWFSFTIFPVHEDPRVVHSVNRVLLCSSFSFQLFPTPSSPSLHPQTRSCLCVSLPNYSPRFLSSFFPSFQLIPVPSSPPLSAHYLMPQCVFPCPTIYPPPPPPFNSFPPLYLSSRYSRPSPTSPRSCPKGEGTIYSATSASICKFSSHYRLTH